MPGSLADRLDARLNPLLVKEVQQGFRGHGLLIGAAAALLFCLSTYGYLVVTDSASGRNLFEVLHLCLAVVSMAVIPAGAGRQLQHEVQDHTILLIAATGLSTRRNLHGRLQAALLKILLIYALMAPFVVVTVLLGNIGFQELITAVAFELLIALGLCAVAIMFGASAALGSPAIRLLLNAQLVLFLMLGGGFVMLLYPDLLRIEGGVLWVWWLWILLAVVTCTAFCLRVGADLLDTQRAGQFRWAKMLLGLFVAVLVAPVPLHPAFDLPGLDVRPVVLFASVVLLLFFPLAWSNSKARREHSWEHSWSQSEGQGIGGFASSMIYAAIGLGLLLLVSREFDSGGDAARALLVIYAYYLFAAGSGRLLARLYDPHGSNILLAPILTICTGATFVVSSAAHSYLVGAPLSSAATLVFPGYFLLNEDLLPDSGLLLLIPTLAGALLGWFGRPRRRALAAQ